MFAFSLRPSEGSQSRAPSAAAVMCVLSSVVSVLYTNGLLVLVRGRPAVHGKEGAGDKRRLGVQRKWASSAISSGSTSRLMAGSVSMILSTTSSSEMLWARLIRYLALDERRSHVDGADRVRGHALRPALQSHNLRKTFEAMLGGDVRGLVRRGDETVDGEAVDHASPTLLIHTR